MEKILENRRSFIINFLYFAIITGLYFFAIRYAMAYIFPFVIAVALAVFLQKPVRKISEKLHLKAHGAVSIILVLLIVVAILGAAAGIIILITNEFRDFFSYLSSQFDSVEDVIFAVKEFVLEIVAKLPGKLSQSISVSVNNFFADLSSGEAGSFDLNMLTTPLSGAWSVVKSIPSFIIGVVVTVISCVFVTAEYGEIRNMILGMCTEEKGRRLITAKSTVTKGVGKLIRAYATIMFITFLEVFLGLNLMKLIGVYDGGYIFVIALVTCVVDIIPVLGTGTVLIPWAIYGFISGNVGLGVGLLILYAAITVIRQITEPKLVANQVGLPSIVTIMAMFIGARVLGPFGILILPLTIVVLKLMYDEGVVGNKVHIRKLGSDNSVKEDTDNA